jgi:hypothetical protein
MRVYLYYACACVVWAVCLPMCVLCVRGVLCVRAVGDVCACVCCVCCVCVVCAVCVRVVCCVLLFLFEQISNDFDQHTSQRPQVTDN